MLADKFESAHLFSQSLDNLRCDNVSFPECPQRIAFDTQMICKRKYKEELGVVEEKHK